MRTVWLPFGLWLSLLLLVASGCCKGNLPGQQASSQPAASAAEVQEERRIGFLTELGQGMTEAHQTGKPLLVFFTTSQCGFCRQMLEKTFQDRQIVELAERFVCVQIEADEAPQVCKDFHIQAFPTVQFITAEGAPLQRVLGRKEPEVLAAQMQAALQSPLSRTAYWSGGTVQR